MDLLQRVLMPLNADTLDSSINRSRPTYARDTIDSLNIRSAFPGGVPLSGNMSSFAMGAVAGAMLQNGMSGQNGFLNNTVQSYPQQACPQQQGYPQQQAYPQQQTYPQQQSFPQQQPNLQQQIYPQQQSYLQQPYPQQQTYPQQPFPQQQPNLQQPYPQPQRAPSGVNRQPQSQSYNIVQPCYSAQQSSVPAAPARLPLPHMQMPPLKMPVQRGQKISLPTASHPKLRVGFGWNVNDARCDVDASVFALDNTGRVPNDDWLIFYGAPESPDKAIIFHEQGAPDRQAITVDLDRLSKAITKLVVVLTLYEPFETNVNFSMISDAYLRVTDEQTGYELASFRVSDYFENVTSMTLGELYYRNGQWKFNPVGNGVHQDLSGQCAIYGVAISN